MAYSRDTQVELKGTFKDAAGSLTDPTEVVLQILGPVGTVTSFSYSAAEVTRVSLGVFTYDVVLDKSGPWYYRYKATGALTTADWKRIDVTDDPLD